MISNQMFRYNSKCIRIKFGELSKLGDNCFQNFHLGRYIIGYTVRNLVLRQHARYASPNENFEYGYPHSNALLQFRLKLERCNLHKGAQMRKSSNEV